MNPLFDTQALFEAFQQGRTAADQGARVLPVSFTSRHTALLVEEDQAFAENTAFVAPLFLPDGRADGALHHELCVLFHGLNEGTEAKLFPWAASLAARGTPALVLPSAFHLARRPASFLSVRGDGYAARREVAGNARVSPYNAVLSGRMAARPDRFLRGALQSYRDLVDLARALREGAPSPLGAHFAPGTRLSFLGYSIGGYLALLALLANEDELFSHSRAVLFSTGAAHARLRPQTILILDVDAQDRLTRYYDNDASRAGQLPLFDALGATLSERRWLWSMLHADDSLRQGLGALGPRLRAIANTTDQVFPIDAVREALAGVTIDALALGLHELPFNQSAPLGEAYTDREGRRLLLTVIRSHTVAEELRPAFARFVDLCHGHLAGALP